VGNSEDRVSEYRATAKKLRLAAEQAHDPLVRTELSWLAQSYARLAEQVEHGVEHPRVAEGERSLEIPKPQNK